jgi:endoplasmic reticulum-Golgi intermediate compartment protein 3
LPSAPTMTLSDRLKSLDAHSSVSKEFRVYTAQGAVLSVVTLVLVVYLVTTELFFNFQLTLEESVHVNATSPRGIEMEFDITLPRVPCSFIQVDASDPAGQSQSLHLDTAHHLWKHRVKVDDQNWDRVTLIGAKAKLELGSTMLNDGHLQERLLTEVQEASEADEEECGSCYGAGEEDECCNTCEDVKRAYKRKGWLLTDYSEIKVCKEYKQGYEEEDEGCNVHGVIALDSGGGNLHLAPGKDFAPKVHTKQDNFLEMLLQTYQQWNVSHAVNKLRFGPETPAGVYQLDGQRRVVDDSSAMYQYYIQVRHTAKIGVARLLASLTRRILSHRPCRSSQPATRSGTVQLSIPTSTA